MANLEKLKKKINRIQSSYKHKKERIHKRRKYSQISKRFRQVKANEKEREIFKEELISGNHCKQCLQV